jgi:hypothetical protein
MKRLYNFLVPKFLRDFDDYLLRNSPVVWRTKAIFVVFYGLVAIPFLFAGGFFYPVDAQHLTVEHDKEIRMGYDTYHLWSVLLVGMGLFYWAYRQYQLGFPFTKIKDTLLTLVLYALCMYVLFAFTTPAFRLGTIYKTAYHWIDTDDMKQLETSKIYPHGFVLLLGDTIYKRMPTDTFFKRHERMFDAIWHVEDTLLLHLYTNDTAFWKNWYATHEFLNDEMLDRSLSDVSSRSDVSYLSSLSSLSYLSSLSDVPYLSYLSSLSGSWSRLGRWSMSYQRYVSNVSYQSLSERSYRWFLAYRSYELPLSVVSSQVYQIASLPHLPYRSYQSYRSDLSNMSGQLKAMELDVRDPMNWKEPSYYLSHYLSYLSSYEQYKQKHTTYTPVFDKYGFNKSRDSIRISIEDSGDSLTVYRAALPYSVEHAVYAIKHARLYLAEKIYTKHGLLVLKYALLLAALFYCLPFLSIRHVFGLLATCLLGSVIIAFKLPEHVSSIELGQNISNGLYLLLPLLSCLLLLWSSFRKKQTQGLVFAEQGLFVGLLCVLIGALFIIYREKAGFTSIESFKPPYNLAFYGVQVLGVLGAVLTTYVRTLPKG